MGAKSTSSREQTDNMQAIGYDGYNGTITGEQAATLGVNCGMTTGRNGVLVKAIGFDVYNMAETGGVSKTLNSIRSDADHVPVVFVLNDQGGKEMTDGINQTNAIKPDKMQKQPCVMVLNDQGGRLLCYAKGEQTSE